MAFNPPIDYPQGEVYAGVRVTEQTFTSTEKAQARTNIGAPASTSGALTTPVIDGVTYSAANERQVIVEVYPLSGTALHAAIVNAVTFTSAALILRVIADITTVATAACTLDIGYSTTTATTSDTLLDGIDVNSAIGVFDSMDPTLDTGTNAHAQKAASGKFITVDEKTGDATGLVGNLYIFYIPL